MSTRIFFAGCFFATLVAFTSCGTESNGARLAPAPGDTIPPVKTEQDVQTAGTEPGVQKFPRNELVGKFDPLRHSDFVSVGKPFADRPGMLLRRAAFEAFQKMWEAARRDSVSLKIISSTRTFAQQKMIWERKWARLATETPDPEARALKILEYSAMPGASRHHWGTDIDLNDLNNPSFETGGTHSKVYDWMQKNAHRFGFCQPYTPKGAERPHGYNEEKWHWSYQPLAAPMLRQYAQEMQDSQIVGFLGAETAGQIGIVGHYVLGVNTVCKQ